MRADQEDHLGARVVRARPVDAAPELVARAGARGADVGVRVVPVDAPGGHDALGEAVLAGPADVVHDLLVPILLHRRPNPAGDVVERLVPADLLPLAVAALADPLQRVEDAIGVGHLVERRRSLGAVAAARAGVLRVAFELAQLEGLFVHVRQETARRLAVEAGGRHQHVALLDPFGPRLRIELHPIVPALLGRERGQVDPTRPRVERLSARLGLGAGGTHQVVQLAGVGHASGTA